MSVHYVEILKSYKMIFFDEKKKIFFSFFFFFFAQKIIFGYALEPPQWGSSNECPQSML